MLILLKSDSVSYMFMNATAFFFFISEMEVAIPRYFKIFKPQFLHGFRLI